jgi:hypothetical protein
MITDIQAFLYNDKFPFLLVEILVGIAITIITFLLQRKEQKEYNDLINKMSEVINKTESLVEYQQSLNYYFLEKESEEILWFTHHNKSP